MNDKIFYKRIMKDVLTQLKFVEKYFLESIDKNNKLMRREISSFFLKDTLEYLVRLNKITYNFKFIKNKTDLRRLEKDFFESTDKILSKAYKLEILLNNKALVKKIKQAFRDLVERWIYKGKIVKRGYEKPRGYAGDYKLLEMIYNNTPLSTGLGLFCDKYLLNDHYVIAVRNRKDEMKKILKNFIKNCRKVWVINILNLASGGAREIRELLTEDRELLKDRKIKFTLVDQDGSALEFSKNLLKKNLFTNVKFKFLKENVLNFFRYSEKYTKKLGRYDLIYSIGLADYILNLSLKELINFCFYLLKPKGELIIAHKDTKTYESLASDWFCNWTFYPRSEEDLITLINDALPRQSFYLKVSREKAKHIFFIFIKREKI
jgi:hypothetical protein